MATEYFHIAENKQHFYNAESLDRPSKQLCSRVWYRLSFKRMTQYGSKRYIRTCKNPGFYPQHHLSLKDCPEWALNHWTKYSLKKYKYGPKTKKNNGLIENQNKILKVRTREPRELVQELRSLPYMQPNLVKSSAQHLIP